MDNLINKIDKINSKIKNEKTRLSKSLNNLGMDTLETESLTQIVDKVSLKGTEINKIVIKELQVSEPPKYNELKIKWKIEQNKPAQLTYTLVMAETEFPMKNEEINIDADGFYNFHIKHKYIVPDLTYDIYLIVSNGVNTVTSETIQATTAKALILGFTIDTKDSNPSSSVKYTDGAAGMIPAQGRFGGSWDNVWPFNKIRVVGFKDGKVFKEINKINKKKYIDGTDVGEDVDVMIEIPRVHMWTHVDNGIITIKISQVAETLNWLCHAHTVGRVDKDYIYIGAYIGSFDENSILRSKPGYFPVRDKKINEVRLGARKHGEGYCQLTWHMITLLRVLFILKYKNLNSQSALGKGLTNYSSYERSGGTVIKGMDYGESSGTKQMCFLGIEDLWGNLPQFVDGIVSIKDPTDGGQKIMTEVGNDWFTDDGSGYENYLKITSVGSGNYIKEVCATNLMLLFFPTNRSGSESTYFCDGSNITNGNANICYCGGKYNEKDIAGIFRTSLDKSVEEANLEYSGRLCYVGVK